MRKYFILFLIIMVSSVAKAQKGDIKIFSEIKNINIYLDEIFQGTDILEIDSVQTGAHYLKILKDSIIVFSELIDVKENSATTVLVKNTDEVKKKLLESKVNEIQEYKSKKLDVILSKNYITQTKGISSSYYFPGYYITTGTGFYNSVSETSEYTDWKIVQGGKSIISEREFGKLTGDNQIEENYNRAYKNYQERLKKYNKKINIGAIVAIPSIIITGVILADLLGSKPFLNLSPETEAVIGTAGILGSVIGYGTVMKGSPPVFNPGHLTSVKKASENAFKYNQMLKKQLGLPESFETGM